MKHSILLLGANGQVGHALNGCLSGLGLVVPCTRAELDLAQSPAKLGAALIGLLQQHRPTIVLNATAYTAVDRAESEPALAQQLNEYAPGLIAQAAQSVNACMVHYSTDYVFNGEQAAPYIETDTPDPQSVYGRSKLAGEAAVARGCARHLILRTSWVVSAHGGNFLKTMLKLAQERDGLRIVSDQVGAPTTADLLAQTTVQLLQCLASEPASDPRWGLYHLTAQGVTNWHAYACYVIAQARRAGWPIKIQPEAIEAITTAEYPVAARLPLNSSLNTKKIQQTFGLTLPPWQQGVDDVLRALKSVS